MEIEYEMSSRDLLVNLSRFEEHCRCCGTRRVEYAVKDMRTGWVACACGHVYPVENTWRWH